MKGVMYMELLCGEKVRWCRIEFRVRFLGLGFYFLVKVGDFGWFF